MYLSKWLFQCTQTVRDFRACGRFGGQGGAWVAGQVREGSQRPARPLGGPF